MIFTSSFKWLFHTLSCMIMVWLFMNATFKASAFASDFHPLNRTEEVRPSVEVFVPQPITVGGIVKDSTTGEALVGVTVLVKGTTNGTVTNAEGRFQLEAEPDAVLSLSFVGYGSTNVSVNGRTTLNISLSPSSESLEQLVVIGYGTVKKKDLTGSVSSLSSKEINDRPVNDAIQAMQGKIAGVDISSNQRPGEVGDINIRGIRSLTASNSPLFVVDGIPQNTGGINYLNPKDIESIDVLKDASATAIYGSKGANGVVLITTKQGKTGKMEITYSGSATIQKIKDLSPIMSASDFIDFRRWAMYYSAPNTYPRGDQPTLRNDSAIFLATSDPSSWANIRQGWASGTWDGSKVDNICWTCMVTQTGIVNEHTLSVSSGTEKTKVYGSFGYLDNKGTSIGQDYNRYTGNLNVDITPKKWFNFGGSMTVSRGLQEFGQSTANASVPNSYASIYESARAVFRWAVPFDKDGNRIEFPGGDAATKTVVDEWKYTDDERLNLRAFGSFHLQLDAGEIFPVLKGLRYRMNFGPDFSFDRHGTYVDGQSVISSGNSFASLEKIQTFSYTLDNLIYYDRTFGKHTLGLTLLETQTAFHSEGSSMSADKIPLSSMKWNALTTGNISNLKSWNSDLTETQLRSYMYRVNYDFLGKYMLTTSGRWDGASQLAPGHQWDFFPSAALAWNMNEEGFMQGADWLNQLKLRIGVGVTGNSAIDAYSTKGAVSTLFYPFISSVGGGSIPDSSMANLGLGWEKTTQWNLGIDFSLFNYRLSGTLDIYKSGTRDLLMSRSIPTVTGYFSTLENVGKTSGRGIDLSINSQNIKGNFNWNTTLNLTFNKDKIKSLATNADDINNGWFIGQPIGVIYDYQADGLWHESDQAQIDAFEANGSHFEPGNVKVVDQNGDNKIDANNDRIILGSTNPKWILGLTNSFEFKGFDLSVFLYGRLGYLYDAGGESEDARHNNREINYYTEINQTAEWQKPIYGPGPGDPYYEALGYRSGNFIEVRNVSLGYSFSRSLLSDIGLSSLRVYLQGQDLGMLYSRVSWLNLDVGSAFWNRGITFGVDVTF